MSNLSALPAGSVIGILGGGQLGRMLAMSAARLGYRCHILAPEEDSVAAEVACFFTCADYDDETQLNAFAESCDVITYEFENVPVGPLSAIKDSKPLRPGPKVLEIAQSRIDEKRFATKLGGKTAPFAMVEQRAKLAPALEKTGLPAILKTNRFGYDGKGQLRVTEDSNLAHVWQDMDGQSCIAEGMVHFDAEFSVILVRGGNGEIRYWDSPRNVHDDGILATSSFPAGPLIESQEADARKLTAKIAESLDYVGVLTCEFFATAAGPIFNEMAPRVHNSGHWSIEGAVTSQFENHIRAICGLPLGDTALTAERIEMENLIGKAAATAQKKLSYGDTHLHLYGKTGARAGRKMGHITRLYR